MPIGDALIAILHSLQDPRLLRVRARVRRAAQPLARSFARPLARLARRGSGPRRLGLRGRGPVRR